VKLIAIALIAILSTVGSGLAAPRQAYCYATVQASGGKLSRFLGKECTLYITPVFPSEDSADLLSAEFNMSVPEAGLSTCVTTEDEPDLPKAWKDFVDNSKAAQCNIVTEPPPGETPTDKPGG
jgi:hypothetical protein